MDNLQFDALAARLAARLNRRSSLGFLAATGLPLGLAGVTGVAGKAKKVTLCVNGKTVKAPKKKAKKLLKKGATKGACAAASCPTGRKVCGAACIPNDNCCVNRDCPSPSTCDDGQCLITTGPPGCALGFCSVFVTSTVFDGGEIGGLTGADDKCQVAALGAGLSGRFKAWLSAGNQTPATRFAAGTGPWRLRPNDADGNDLPPVVATNLTDLVTCSGNCLQHAIDRTQTGEIVSGFNAVWTATFADGTASSQTCAGWTSSTGGDFGFLGDASKADAEWTNAARSFGCNIKSALYCFEQAV